MFEAGSLRQLLTGEVQGIGGGTARLAAAAEGVAVTGPDWPAQEHPSHEAVLSRLLPWLQKWLGGRVVAAAGHRVVHGGRDLVAPRLIDAATLSAIEALVPLAPLHQPHCLAAIRAVAAILPNLPQIACFDTAFHRTMPAVARHFALPRALTESGIERYGFHGLSYEFIAGRLAELDPDLAAGRVVVAHLGSGASLCALAASRSIDTTMGLTALDGLPMGSRCGALDPGIVLYLARARGMDTAALEDLLYHRSGLLGVSGISADLRDLLASADPHAAEAVDMFAFGIARLVAQMTASLQGLDGLVFTAGIGEHAPVLREKVCARLGWLGLALDAELNECGRGRVSAQGSKVAIWVVPTDEDAVIARHTQALIAPTS